MAKPSPHNYGSFSYKVTDQKIQNILRARSQVNNVVQVGMPFVKATGTVEMPELLGNGNLGFTLGIHGLLDAGYESIYAQGSSESPLVGYTYTKDGRNERVYATIPTTNQQIAKYFTQQLTLQNTPDSFNRIPPPGITGLKIGTNRAGLSSTAELQISVPSLQQLEFLNRVFLIPGCGMVVEWGQQFASDRDASLGERGLIGNLQEKMFPWYRPSELGPLLDKLSRRQVGLEEILEQYVYPTEGQYMWMFGRVANIGTKGNADGSFDVTVKIVGPAEDQWAYSVRQTAMASASPEGKICPDDGNSVESYLTQTTAGFNLKTLLDEMEGGTNERLTDWAGHVIKIDNGNKNKGSEGSDSNANANQSSFADVDNAYFMTWRFFVNVVLNDEEHGIKGIFSKAQLAPEIIEKMGIIRPYTDSLGNTARADIIEDPYENYVGNNKWLRSYDPGTMIIVNEYAGSAAESLFKYEVQRANDGSRNTKTSAYQLEENTRANDITTKFSKGAPQTNTVGGFDFTKSTGQPINDVDKGFLSTGVWLNHKAVITSLLSGNTIMQGISNLLGKMNNATRGYWALTLDVSEPVEEGDKFDYYVVDQYYRGSSETAISTLIDGEQRIYTFNKFLRNSNQGVVGSELTDFSMDLDLPKLLFSQISTMGLSQAGDVEAASPTTALLQPCKNPTVSEANDTLRRMIGISTISPSKGDVSIDITNRNTSRVVGECGSPSLGSAPAGTAGQGLQPVKPGPDESKDAKRFIDEQKKASDYINDPKNECAQCTPCYRGQSPTSPSQVQIVQIVSNSTITDYCSTLTGNEKQFCQIAVREGITEPVELAQLLAQFKHESNLEPVSERLSYSAEFLYRTFPKTPNRSWGFTSVEDARPICCGKDSRALANRIYGSRMGNTEQNDGYKYRGRGMVQLTGKDNYIAAGSAIREDLVNNPDLLLRFDVASKASIWFWKTRVKPLVIRNNTNFQDTTTVTRSINGGTIGLQDRLNKFLGFLRTFGIGTRVGSQSPSTPTNAPPGTSGCTQELRQKCRDCITQDMVFRQTGALIQDTRTLNNALAGVTRDFPNLNAVLRYVEILPDRMASLIRCDSNGNRANSFGAAPTSLSIKAELTLPGIAGIRVGELFWIDRIQALYKIFGAFQVMSIEHDIGQDGWQTKISSKFNSLGQTWKNTMLELLSKADIELRGY
jgi:putative chitinase